MKKLLKAFMCVFALLLILTATGCDLVNSDGNDSGEGDGGAQSETTVTLEEWNSALSFSGKSNYTYDLKSSTEGYSLEMFCKIDGNKYYTVTTSTFGEDTFSYESYCVAGDAVHGDYVYNRTVLGDGYAEWEGMKLDPELEHDFGTLDFSEFVDDYEALTYNEERDTYSVTDEEGERIYKFSGGKLIYAKFTLNESDSIGDYESGEAMVTALTELSVRDYGTTVVTLPDNLPELKEFGDESGGNTEITPNPGGDNTQGGDSFNGETAPEGGTDPEGGKDPEGGTDPEGGKDPEGGTDPEGGKDHEGGTDPEGGKDPDGGATLPDGPIHDAGGGGGSTEDSGPTVYTVTEEEWKRALGDDSIPNVTISYSIETNIDGEITVETYNAIYAENAQYLKYHIFDGEGELVDWMEYYFLYDEESDMTYVYGTNMYAGGEYIFYDKFSGKEHVNDQSLFVANYEIAINSYSSMSYDENKLVYSGHPRDEVKGLKATYGFENGKLVSFSASMSTVSSGMVQTSSLTDYGTSKINIPKEVSELHEQTKEN